MVSLTLFSSLVAVVPAAGVGKRMKASCPKQYLKIDGLTILEHTVLKLLFHPNISQVILVISEGDEYVNDTSLVTHPDIIIVNGVHSRKVLICSVGDHRRAGPEFLPRNHARGMRAAFRWIRSLFHAGLAIMYVTMASPVDVKKQSRLVYSASGSSARLPRTCQDAP